MSALCFVHMTECVVSSPYACFKGMMVSSFERERMAEPGLMSTVVQLVTLTVISSAE